MPFFRLLCGVGGGVGVIDNEIPEHAMKNKILRLIAAFLLAALTVPAAVAGCERIAAHTSPHSDVPYTRPQGAMRYTVAQPEYPWR